MNETSGNVAAAFRGNQLLCIALLVGQFLFGITVAVIHSVGGLPEAVTSPEAVEMFGPIGIVAGVVSVPMAFFLRRSIWNRGSSGDAAMVIRSFLAGNLAFQALLEGASLLNLTFWLITAEAAPYLPVAVALFVVGLTGIPRRSQVSGNAVT